MTDIVWPRDLAPYRVAFYLQAHVGGTESPFNRQRKTYGLSAPRWVARFTFRGGHDAPRAGDAAGFARRLDALLAEAEGIARFALWDWRRPAPLRSFPILGSGPKMQAAAAGATMVTLYDLAPGSVLTRGDYIGGDGRAHIVTQDAIAGGDGTMQVRFRPPLSSPILNAAPAITSEVKSWFRLAADGADDAAATETDVGQLTEHTLSFVEDLAGA